MPDSLTTARGFRDLGLLDDALKTLDNAAPQEKTSVPAILLRLEICTGLEQWESVAVAAREGTSTHPDSVTLRLAGSEAIRRAESLAAAHTFLLEGLSTCAGSAAWLYKLACYESLLGSQSTARSFLKRAVSLDPALYAGALHDPDLESFWTHE